KPCIKLHFVARRAENTSYLHTFGPLPLKAMAPAERIPWLWIRHWRSAKLAIDVASIERHATADSAARRDGEIIVRRRPLPQVSKFAGGIERQARPPGDHRPVGAVGHTGGGRVKII